MIIAAVYTDGMVDAFCAENRQFKLYTVEDDRICKMEVVTAPEGDEFAQMSFLKESGVGFVVCSKLSMQMQTGLMLAGIAPFAGFTGEADLQVGVLLMGMLELPTETDCTGTYQEGGSCEKCAHKDECRAE